MTGGSVAVAHRPFRVMLCVLALSPVVHAADETEAEALLRSATALYESLEYEQALEQLERAKALARTPEEDVRVSLLQGAVSMDLGKRAQAAWSFRRALALDPDVRLTFQVSPKVVSLLEATRRKVHRELGRGGLKRLRAARDQRRQALATQAAAQVTPVPNTPQETSVVPPSDEGGGTVDNDRPVPSPTLQPRLKATSQAEARPVAMTSRPSIRPWAWLPGGIAAAAGGTATFLYLRARADYTALESGTLSQTEADQVRRRGQAFQTSAFALAGVSVASLLAMGGVLIWGGPQEGVAPTAWFGSDSAGAGISAKLP